MTATRRLASIMAVDVFGYSRLMGEDEAGTVRAVCGHQDAARRVAHSCGVRERQLSPHGLNRSRGRGPSGSVHELDLRSG
jgi:class 3 adenylate cyclase